MRFAYPFDEKRTPLKPWLGNLPGGRPELWDSGLRNPYRFTFDACTGDMYLADEGQNTTEEVNVEPAGTGKKNYGWATMEGNQCVQAGCNQAGGAASTALRGRYIYGDYCSGRIWSVASGGMPQELLLSGQQITGFGQDSKFELYVLAQTGAVYRLDP